jgi:hypothetical protein
MYSKTSMYLGSGKSVARDSEARYWGRSRGTVDRLLLTLGAIALVGLVPMLWIWVLYGSGLGTSVVHGAAIGLCLITAGIGFAMIRILDGRR